MEGVGLQGASPGSVGEGEDVKSNKKKGTAVCNLALYSGCATSSFMAAGWVFCLVISAQPFSPCELVSIFADRSKCKKYTI
jgi:hypothetical protein